MAKFEVKMTRTVEFTKTFEVEAANEAAAEIKAQDEMEKLALSDLITEELEDDSTDIVTTQQIEEEDEEEEEELDEEEEDDEEA